MLQFTWLCCKFWLRAREQLIGSGGLSGRFELKPFAEKLDRLGQSGGAEAKVRSTRRASPRMSRVMLNADACPLRSARVTSKPLIVA